jgi:hypothetical protein
MRSGYLILGLVALIAIVSMFVGLDPEHAERLSEMRRGAGFTGETREIALFVGALVIGGFIVYLTVTRR